MPSLYNADLKPIRAGESTHSYDHATKLFIADNLRLAPKQSFLYYVVINLDTSQTQAGGGILNSALNFADRFQSLQTGMLVKRVDLPKFTMNTKTMNSYNRKNIIQTHITYDPVTITFHDDAADIITNFWNDYYTYYYRDSDYETSAYGQPYKYQPRNRIGWGYTPRNSGLPNFLSSIRIFSLHNKRFTEYYLANPVINSWRHGEHNASLSTGTLENTMNVSYETVKYFTGFINPVSVDGFSLLSYDNTQSPIATSTSNILGNNGLIGAIEGAPRDLRKPDGTSGAGGPVSSLISAYRTYNNLKNVNLNNVVGTTLASYGASVINNVLNGTSSFGFPTAQPTSGTNSQSAVGNYGYAGASGGGGVTIGGAFAGIATGAAINATNTVLGAATSSITRGINSAITGFQPVTAGATAVYDAVNNPGSILIDPSRLQPVTGINTAVVLDSSGRLVTQLQVTGTRTGSYNPGNLSENLLSAQTVTDPSGQEVLVNVYRDGTVVKYDSITGDQLSIVPGSNNSQVLGIPNYYVNTDPLDARTQAALGVTLPANSLQYRTDPRTGLIYTVGGTTSAVITNTVTGTAGVVAGLYTGQALNDALNSTFLGKSLIGRTIATATATATGAAVGRVVNNGLQPIVNKFIGDVSQGWDDSPGKIKNVVSGWTGTGGYEPSRPLDNVVSTTYSPAGGSTTVYKNGDILYEDPNGAITYTPGTNDAGLLSFFNRSTGVNVDSAATSPPYGSVWTDSQGIPINTGSGSVVTQANPDPWEVYNLEALNNNTNYYDETPIDIDVSGVGPGPSDAEISAFNDSLGGWEG